MTYQEYLDDIVKRMNGTSNIEAKKAILNEVHDTVSRSSLSPAGQLNFFEDLGEILEKQSPHGTNSNYQAFLAAQAQWQKPSTPPKKD